MNNRFRAGFTIIEVMLFLAVTGTLAIGVLGGSGVAISNQRYRDSVSSLKSFLQEQYSQTITVSNSRDGTEACSLSGPSATERGTSECLLLGRFVTISPDGRTITASSVLGQRNATNNYGATDLEDLKNYYRFAVSSVDSETKEVEWGARVVAAGAGTTPRGLSMLIIRAPLSGAVMTFTSEDVKPSNKLGDLIAAGVATSPTNLCVDADGSVFQGQRLAVRINARATGPTAIEVPAERDSVCE